MLAINIPPNSCRALEFGFLGVPLNYGPKKSNKIKTNHPLEYPPKDTEKESSSDNESVRETHSLLRQVHQAIFDEQVFDMVNRGAFNQYLGVNVTGMQENYLQLSIDQGTSVFIPLVPSKQDDQTVDSEGPHNIESEILPLDSFDGVKLAVDKHGTLSKNSCFPNCISCKIYYQQIFHEHFFVKSEDRPLSSSIQVPLNLQKVCSVPYLHLISHPTWHSRKSSWTIFLKVPRSILHSSSQLLASGIQTTKNVVKSDFRTKVVVNDDCISIEAEGAPNVVGLFKGSSEDICSTNEYDCDLVDLPVIILQQVASQVIRWLHEEALMVGIKANHDFLSLSIELEQGEMLSLVAHVDPEDAQGCISWWLVIEDGLAEERKLHMDIGDGPSDYKKFLGHLQLDVLYSTLMDLVSLCCGSGSH